jgi:three-Cys-motif partner protein
VSSSSFFDESKEQSRIKADIVAKYLWAWAKVVIPSTKKRRRKIGYIDLFAGPGRYKDGTKSTPLLVLERAINDPDMRDMLVTAFSDSEPTNAQSLRNSIDSIPNIETLKNKPQVYIERVDEKITEIFKSIRMIPSLTFLDPWGYKGLSYRLIDSVIKDWGCDCIIFFNYNRINMGLGNDKVAEHMNALFGNESAARLRIELDSLNTSDRERKILNALSDTLKNLGGNFVLPFRFRGEIGNRISHHIIFVTKHRKGYDMMKEIMAKASSNHYQEVPSFEYSPLKNPQLCLFPPNYSLDKLKNELTDLFAGQSLSMLELYNTHNLDTCYIKKNYKKALMQLEEQGNVVMNPSADKRRKNTLGDDVKVIFPFKRGRK